MSRKSPRHVPTEVLRPLREICRVFPEVREERAWTGIRWRIRRNTFAHVLMIEDGWPPAYATAAGVCDSACVLTFRSVQRASQPRAFDHPPFFRPRWFPNIVGMIVDENVVWTEVQPLLEQSYRLMAPRKLAFAQVSSVSRKR